MKDDDVVDKKYNSLGLGEARRPVLEEREARAMRDWEQEENLFLVSFTWVCAGVLVLTITGVLASVASQYLV